jgi:pantothenate kinase
VDPEPARLTDLVEAARRLALAGPRTLLGITGAPGAGKSTLARHLVDALGPDLAVLVPMDGFHLANATLRAWGRRDRKGAPDTFDAAGYVNLLRRLRATDEEVVHAPTYDRGIEESIGSAVPVPSWVRLVVTEGNYLLTDLGAWAAVPPLLDESWYLDLDEETRLERLVARHERHGKEPDHARAWATGTDERNAALVRRGRYRADRVVRLVDESDDTGERET